MKMPQTQFCLCFRSLWDTSQYEGPSQNFFCVEIFYQKCWSIHLLFVWAQNQAWQSRHFGNEISSDQVPHYYWLNHFEKKLEWETKILLLFFNFVLRQAPLFCVPDEDDKHLFENDRKTPVKRPTSFVWKYFTKHDDFSVCEVCSQKLKLVGSSRHSTSGMRYHLKNIHNIQEWVYVFHFVNCGDE